ncbi:MAG: RNA methyltransferase [Clostridia bacterium]|nr:RNA methyltransferase [Clostridia bacterium]
MKEIITSRQNPRIKFLCGLAEKKKRRQLEMFRFDGIKLLREALLCGIRPEAVFVRVPLGEEVDTLLRFGVTEGLLREENIVYVSDSVFEKLSEEKSPEGVITVSRFLTHLHRSASDSPMPGGEERLLIVEALRDPGNLGTVMRSCAALGIDRLIISSDCAELYNPKTVRSTMGALFRLPTVEVAAEDLSHWIGILRQSGRRVFAAALREDAISIGSFSLQKGDCFVIGNEGHGLSEDTISACDGCAVIPMREGNESLNAAAAASICIWETVRSACH